MTGKWISVMETLPCKNMKVWVTVLVRGNRYVHESLYIEDGSKGYRGFCDWDDYTECYIPVHDVLAWMPFESPEAYAGD